MDDPKFDGIREDARLFGSWAILLLYADRGYPASIYRPPPVTPAAMKKLVACGLVDELPSRRYRIHGLAADREMRTQSARNAAALRWQSESNAVAMPRREEKRKEEKEKTQGMRAHNSVDRDPLLREIRTVYLAKDKEKEGA
jgi:hypothetical protein